MQVCPFLLITAIVASVPLSADVITEVNKINSLEKGKTTSDEVIKLFGKPYHEDNNPDGRFVYLYKCSLPPKSPEDKPFNATIAFLFSPEKKLVKLQMYKEK